MKTWSEMLLGLTVSALSVAGFHVIHVSAWRELSGEQKQVLVPIRHRWNLLPVRERARLVQVAREYGSLSPDMQHRLSERLLTWTALGASERSAAREHYRQFRSLPPDKRRELINKWKKQHLG
jgi:hypothetical protein